MENKVTICNQTVLPKIITQKNLFSKESSPQGSLGERVGGPQVHCTARGADQKMFFHQSVTAVASRFFFLPFLWHVHGCQIVHFTKEVMATFCQ